jgi:hypothetical protein
MSGATIAVVLAVVRIAGAECPELSADCAATLCPASACPSCECPEIPACPACNCGEEEEEPAEIPEPHVYQGDIKYPMIAWSAIALTFVPLLILFITDKIETSGPDPTAS